MTMMCDTATHDTATHDAGPLALTCIARRDETPGVITFRLRGAAPLDWQAGQALMLKVPLPGGAVWRSFTISGGSDGAAELTIKAQAAGGATRWLHDQLVPGTAIAARPPRGQFTLALWQGGPLAFVSAGTGATPMLAMLRALAETDPGADVAWLHCARSPADVLFAAELAALQARMPGLAVTVSVSRPGPGWFGYRRRLSRRMLATALPDLGRRTVFCCGPQGFMAEARLIHAAEGGARGRFHTESFGGAAAPAPQPAAPGSPPETQPESPEETAFRLTVGPRDLAIRSGESVLQASLRQGVIIPCGCGEGMCGTCMVRLVSGEVRMAAQGGITAEEQAQGYILACSSHALSDLRLALD